jgi:hypothetical protein
MGLHPKPKTSFCDHLLVHNPIWVWSKILDGDSNPQDYGIYTYFSSHFPSLLCSRTSIVQAWGRSHLTQMLCKYYVAKSFEEQKKKMMMKKEKKLWWEEKKSKKNRKNKVKKRKREKWERNKIKVKKYNKDAPRIFLLHKFLSALMTNPYSNLPTMCNPITRTSLVPRDLPFATCACPPI